MAKEVPKKLTFSSERLFHAKCRGNGCKETIVLTEKEIAEAINNQYYECPACGTCHEPICLV